VPISASKITARRLGGELRRARKARGLTQRQLAERLGTDAPYLSRLEHGEKNLTIAQLARIADALDTGLSITLTSPRDHGVVPPRRP